MPMSEPVFTPDQDTEIARLYQDGWSLRAIAKHFGTYIAPVGNSLKRTATPRRPAGHDWRFTDQEARVIAQEYEAGASLNDLRSKYICDISTLRRTLKRVGVVPRRRGAQERELLEGQWDEIVRRWEAGESQSAIARSLGLSQARVNSAMRKAGYRPVARRPMRETHGSWKGGRIVTAQGYCRVRVDPDDPMFSMSDLHGYALEHRLVVARSLGRPLARHETVHHKNGVRDDNRIENLELRQGQHGRGAALRCADCGSTHLVPVAP